MIRWIKVFRDLWKNLPRTILVILSIAVGIFAIGVITTTQQALTTSLSDQYSGIHPADAIILTEPGLDDDFVTSLRHIRGLREVEGRRALAMRLSQDGQGDSWRDITLYSLADYDDQRLQIVRPQDGVWPPEKGQVLMERASMDILGLEPGEEILVKTPEGRQFNLLVTGRAHDLYRIPPVIEGWIYGYVSMNTLQWMGQAEGYNEIYLDVAENQPGSIRTLSDKVADRIENEGLPVYQKTLLKQGEHPMDFIISTVLVLLGLLAVLSMLLSCLLVINVISALISQQERQIGVMKAVGARSWQLIGLYSGMVLFLGVIACLIAIPTSTLGAEALSGFMAKLMNFDAPTARITLRSFLLQVLVGLALPLLAAAPAIISGTRVSPARVLSEYGIPQAGVRTAWLDRILGNFHGLTRDILMAFRNPFRKRGRLILSLATLAFAGAVFMAIVNLRVSLNDTLDTMLGFWGYDAWLVVDGYVPAERLIQEAKTVAGVEKAEAWGFTLGRYVRPDGTESDNLYLLAPPAGSQMIHPPIIAGRGLQPGDMQSILVSPGLLANEPGLRVGSRIPVKIEGKEETYTIAGVMNMMGNSTIGYFSILDLAAYTRHVREPNRANVLILAMSSLSPADQRRVASQVEQRYDAAGLDVTSNFLIAEEKEEINGAFSIIVALLMVMTVILAAVGGLGLMGTMSLNVIERTREIGVMRAFGASSASVFRSVIIEGLLIGLISWAIGIGLSLPLSILLARNIGQSFMDNPMNASFSFSAVIIWAALVILISVLSSLFPALRAVRLTVTEVLAYE